MDKILEFIDVKIIENDVKCWFIRSESGILYDDYSRNQYVSLGWNYLTKERLSDMSKNRNHIKDILQDEYKEKSNQVTKIINKCSSFIFEMKAGDYIIFPNHGSTKYTVGILKSYFEGNKSKLYRGSREAEVSRQFPDISKWSIAEELSMVSMMKAPDYTPIDSPYLKRWSFDKITELSYKTIHPKLFISLRNPSSITNLTENRDLFFSSIYPIFHIDDKLSFTFNVTNKDRINAIDINRFTGNIVNLLSREVEDTNIEISQKMSVSSEGPIIFDAHNVPIGSEEWLKLITLFILIAFAIGGTYKFFGVEINSPGVVGLWKTITQTIHINKMNNLERDKAKYEFTKLKREDAVSEEAEEIDSAIEFLRKKGYIIEAESKEAMLEIISESSKSLEIETDSLATVINLRNYKEKKE